MAQKVDQKKQAEQRAFIEAVSQGDKDTMEAMFDASPGLASVRNSDGVSVVALAVYAGQRELARLYRTLGLQGRARAAQAGLDEERRAATARALIEDDER